MKPDLPIALTPALAVADPMARLWLRQAMLRLRREVAWLWRERQLQGYPNERGEPLPVMLDAGLASLDLQRYVDDKAAFFAQDPTALHLSEQIHAQPMVDGPTGAFSFAVHSLALQPVEAFVLALALLPAIDAAAGPVIATVMNESGRGEPSLALAQRLWDEPAAVLACLDASHALFSHGLIAPVDGWAAPLRMPPRVARELALGTPRDICAVPHRRVIAQLGHADCSEAAGQPLCLAQPEALPAQMTQAWLRGEALVLPLAALEADGHGHETLRLPLPALPLTLVIGTDDRAALQRLAEPPVLTLESPPASVAERLDAWHRALPAAAGDPALAELARRWRCEPLQIAKVGAELSRLGRPPRSDELFAAARQALDLGALAQPVTPRFTLDELMLPPAQARQVDELVNAMLNLGRVHQHWGTARAWNEGGLAALFAGPPGTGKTMASEAIADALQLPLFRIDLSQVVNKYIGETEKNLKRLFDAADAADAILFFDEADSLFGKRSEVKDAHDRYANLEVSYLLERMERFKGLAILATNRRKDIDEAFLRRLRFVIEFPLPGAAERLRIWRSVIPAEVDASGVDFEFLAQRFPIAGGHIRAIVFHAFLQAATADAPRVLTMQQLIPAVQREYEKLERAFSLDQFGPHAALLAPSAERRS
ncbi:ATP-binding protein [Roseateles cellulosilyticus]|uniref:ATP-binding protein n=1 Tax=Pelomonas cellulosilytica TaxID=2906762 RepID=A0ABS8XVR3_9BURK|nr:ATP-binding protein [Pelomonas sp. P8]MCE4555800.1 ATP-binding protein [Pelomonas sp. P8]